MLPSAIPEVMASRCPSLISALLWSLSGKASGRYFSVNTFVSNPSGISSRFSSSMMPHEMLVKVFPQDAIFGVTSRLALPKYFS